VPGPSEYNSSIETTGKLKLSKYRSTQLGGVGLMIRSQRFLHTRKLVFIQMSLLVLPATSPRRWASEAVQDVQ
jgi:hypothetical protein